MPTRFAAIIAAILAALAFGVPAAAADDGDPVDLTPPANVCTVCVPTRVPPPVFFALCDDDC